MKVLLCVDVSGTWFLCLARISCEGYAKVSIFLKFRFFILLEFKWKRFIEEIQNHDFTLNLFPFHHFFETPKFYKHLEHRKYAKIIFMAINHNWALRKCFFFAASNSDDQFLIAYSKHTQKMFFFWCKCVTISCHNKSNMM